MVARKVKYQRCDCLFESYKCEIYGAYFAAFPICRDLGADKGVIVMLKPLIAMSAILCAGAAAAQEADWTYKATLYGWFPGMTASVDTKFGTVESEASGSDVLSALDMAFMGSFSAQHGKWGFLGDLLYTDLSQGKEKPLPFFGDLSLRVKLTALSAYALYRVASDPQVQLDFGVGLRNFNIGVEASAAAGTGVLGKPAASASIDGNWTDPLIAMRVVAPINDDWFVMGFADFGGTGSDSQTYQIYGGIGYQFAENWSTQLGYRYMSISHPLNGSDLDLGLSGATLAVSYSF